MPEVKTIAVLGSHVKFEQLKRVLSYDAINKMKLITTIDDCKGMKFKESVYLYDYWDDYENPWQITKEVKSRTV